MASCSTHFEIQRPDVSDEVFQSLWDAEAPQIAWHQPWDSAGQITGVDMEAADCWDGLTPDAQSLDQLRSVQLSSPTIESAAHIVSPQGNYEGFTSPGTSACDITYGPVKREYMTGIVSTEDEHIDNQETGRGIAAPTASESVGLSSVSAEDPEVKADRRRKSNRVSNQKWRDSLQNTREDKRKRLGKLNRQVSASETEARIMGHEIFRLRSHIMQLQSQGMDRAWIEPVDTAAIPPLYSPTITSRGPTNASVSGNPVVDTGLQDVLTQIRDKQKELTKMTLNRENEEERAARNRFAARISPLKKQIGELEMDRDLIIGRQRMAASTRNLQSLRSERDMLTRLMSSYTIDSGHRTCSSAHSAWNGAGGGGC